MKTAILKKEMHNAIDIIDDSTFLKAVYTILNGKQKEYELTSEDKAEIDRRLDKYEKGKSKLYTWEEVKASIKKAENNMSAYNLIVTDDAKVDLQKAYDYLETERKGSGEKLLVRMENTLALIQSNPKIYGQKYRKIRQAKVKPFQYLILYKLYNNTILFFQLFHSKQNPSKKRIGY